MRLNLCVKSPDHLTNYNFVNPITLKQDIVNFHQKIIEEVIALPKRERKNVKKTIKSFLMTTMSFLSLSSKSMAETLNQANPLPATSVGIPPELLELMMSLLQITVAGGIILSVILLATAGIMKMMGKKRRKEAEDWTVDIIKGATQVILAAPVIFLIYYLASMLLKGTSWFVSPF